MYRLLYAAESLTARLHSSDLLHFAVLIMLAVLASFARDHHFYPSPMPGRPRQTLRSHKWQEDGLSPCRCLHYLAPA